MLSRLFSTSKTPVQATTTTTGLCWSLPELIALKRYAHKQKPHTSSTATASGGYQARRKGRGMDFAEVRHYQAGDEIRHMEWRVTAKTGKPHIKLYEEERERPVILMVDFNPSMYFGTRTAFKSYVAAELAALIAWRANAAGDRVGALVYTSESHHEITPKSREAGVLPLLALLHEYTHDYQKQREKDRKETMEQAIIRLRHVIKPGSLIVLISDFYTLNTPAIQQLNRLRQHNEFLAYHITDSLEVEAPLPGVYPMTDSRTVLNINTQDKNLADAYSQACAQRLQHIKETFKKLATPYIQVMTSSALPLLVQQTFPRKSYG